MKNHKPLTKDIILKKLIEPENQRREAILRELCSGNAFQGQPALRAPGRQRELTAAIIEAQERERIRLGHELHDNVNQVLTTARLYLDMIKPANDRDMTLIDKTKTFITNAISEIKYISNEMVLPLPEEKPLAEKINELLEDIKTTGRYTIRFCNKGANCVSLGEEKKTALLRIVQEQLKNIIQHSHARTILVSLSINRKEIKLAISDDGNGFDMGKKRNGIGLSNIYHRATLYKGVAKLATAPGKGCLLTVCLPVGG